MRARALFCALSLAVFCARVQAQSDAPTASEAESDSAFPVLRDDGRPSAQKDPLVLVVEGLDGVIRPAALRARLSTVFGRPVVSLSDQASEAARATLWLAADDKQVTLRMSTPPRPDLWQRIPRAQLGADPVATLVNTLLDMLWSERMKPQGEMRDPFCPPGMVCGAEGATSVRRPVEQAVLDPWDPGYAHFDRGERPSARGETWEGEPATVAPTAALAGSAPAQQVPAASSADAAAAARKWALAALLGGGVHQAGGFARYEVNALRRFPRFDVGLAFIGGRGQPDPARARRAFTALAQYRILTEGLEVDLGASFGIFVAEQSGGADVRPYLRGIGVFAIATHSPLDVLIQSELGTTFTHVETTGAVEYALTLGARYGF